MAFRYSRFFFLFLLILTGQRKAMAGEGAAQIYPQLRSQVESNHRSTTQTDNISHRREFSLFPHLLSPTRCSPLHLPSKQLPSPHRASPTTTLPTNPLSQPTSWAPTLMAGHPLMRARAADYTGLSATGPGDHLWVPPPLPGPPTHPPNPTRPSWFLAGPRLPLTT